MNIRAQTMFGMKSLTPTISPSVELLVFNFCFWHLVPITPHPHEIAPPV